jgi:hypothetical protein
MSSNSSQYRKDHPEWREAEKIRNNERRRKKYNNDPDYKEQVKKRALERYYRKQNLMHQFPFLNFFFSYHSQKMI